MYTLHHLYRTLFTHFINHGKMNAFGSQLSASSLLARAQWNPGTIETTARGAQITILTTPQRIGRAVDFLTILTYDHDQMATNTCTFHTARRGNLAVATGRNKLTRTILEESTTKISNVTWKQIIINGTTVS